MNCEKFNNVTRTKFRATVNRIFKWRLNENYELMLSIFGRIHIVKVYNSTRLVFGKVIPYMEAPTELYASPRSPMTETSYKLFNDLDNKREIFLANKTNENLAAYHNAAEALIIHGRRFRMGRSNYVATK